MPIWAGVRASPKVVTKAMGAFTIGSSDGLATDRSRREVSPWQHRRHPDTA